MAHPIERLRWLAQMDQAAATELVTEALDAVRASWLGRQDLVVAFRRLLQAHPACGPLWWAASAVLLSPDPDAGRRQVEAELDEDTTVDRLARQLPPEALVVTAGSVPSLAEVGYRRGDLHVVVLDAADSGWFAARELEREGVDVTVVPMSAVGPAVERADVVMFESDFVGPDWAIAPAGSLALAATSRLLGRPVTCVARAGSRVPASVASALRPRSGDDALGGDDLDVGALGAAWSIRTRDLVPLPGIDTVIGPAGPTATIAVRPDFAAAPELLAAVGGA